jgi:hypothetical protein
MRGVRAGQGGAITGKLVGNPAASGHGEALFSIRSSPFASVSGPRLLALSF